MRTQSIGAAVVSLAALTIAGCTTSGFGTGQSAGGNIGATFNWTSTGATRGTMVARLSNGQVFQGPFFQITQESRVKRIRERLLAAISEIEEGEAPPETRSAAE